jgi:hypothetical protein
VVDGLCLCAPWFRAYYDFYLILLNIWPSLWGWIEGIQHNSKATAPGWLTAAEHNIYFAFCENEDRKLSLPRKLACANWLS